MQLVVTPIKISTTYCGSAVVTGPDGLALDLNCALACGVLLQLPVKGDPVEPPPVLTRHATHHLVIYYGPGKAKIALITSTITGFRGLEVTQIAMRNWNTRYENQVDLERILANGHFKEGDAGTEEALAEVTRKATKTYSRKLPRSLCLEYLTYTGGYLCTKRTEFYHKHNLSVI